MEVKLDFSIQPQPDDVTCGPTCLHSVYQYYGDKVPLEQVIQEVPMMEGGGTFSAQLASHALKRGYRAVIYPYDLKLFDPSWFDLDSKRLAAKLGQQLEHKDDPRLRLATEGYLEFLRLGGRLRFEDLTKRLIRYFLNQSIPILTGLSSTYLYRSVREYGPKDDHDDLRGQPSGHFVVLSGYNRQARTVRVADPLLPNPFSDGQHYEVGIDRVLCAVLLGVVTYDANLLIIRPR